MKKILIVLAFCFVLIYLILLGIGCQKGISSDARNYLKKIQTWQQKWDNEVWGITNLDAMDQLISEFNSIKPPRETISCKNLFPSGNEFDLYDDHTEFLDALDTYMSALKNRENVGALLKEQFINVMKDPTWSRFYAGYTADRYCDESDAYKLADNACTNTLSKLSIMELSWQGVFSEYLQ